MSEICPRAFMCGHVAHYYIRSFILLQWTAAIMAYLSWVSPIQSSRLCDIIMSCLYMGRHQKSWRTLLWVLSNFPPSKHDTIYITNLDSSRKLIFYNKKRKYFGYPPSSVWLLLCWLCGCCTDKTVCCYHCYPSNKQSQR